MSAIEKFAHTVHELERSKANKNVYRCIHPRCSYFQRREYIVGKEILCSRCKNPFICSWRDLRSKSPRCEFCHNSPRSEALRAAREVAFSAINELPDDIKKSILEETME